RHPQRPRGQRDVDGFARALCAGGHDAVGRARAKAVEFHTPVDAGGKRKGGEHGSLPKSRIRETRANAGNTPGERIPLRFAFSTVAQKTKPKANSLAVWPGVLPCASTRVGDTGASAGAAGAARRADGRRR